MKKLIIFLVLFSLLGVLAETFPASVTQQEARQIAAAWYRHIAPLGLRDYDPQNVYPSYYQGMTTFYTFTFLAGGFVIVAADDASIPILAYSEKNAFDEELTCPAARAWLEDYSRQIFEIRAKGLSSEVTLPQWDAIRKGEFPVSEKRDVGPLLTTTWDQGCYYNTLCPEDPAGLCSHAATGCVATAMAQLMKFHNFPPQGVGWHSYPHPTYGMLEADFGNTTYDWASMPDNLTTVNMPVATIMYHAGVSVNMIYGPYGSGAFIELVQDALKEYFNYDPEMEIHFLSDFQNVDDWKAMLRADLDEQRPVYYGGWSESEGHAFICDGYRTTDNMFHFNWGWSGNHDGWYAIGALNTPWGTWNINNIAITHIKPYNPDLIARINAPNDNALITAGNSVTIGVAAVTGTPDLLKLSIDGEVVASSGENSLTYEWSTSPDDAASHSTTAWAIAGQDSVFHEINLNVAENWIPQASGFQTPLRAITWISAVNENIAWAVVRDGIDEWGTPVQEFTRTTDGGNTWTARSIPNCDDLGCAMIFAMSDLKAYIPMFRYWGNKPRGIYVTIDGGITWTRQATASFSHSYSFPDCIHFFNENDGWCMGDPIPMAKGLEFEIYTTNDGGENWIAVPAVNIPDPLANEYGLLGYSAVNDTLWFGTTQGRVYRSYDKGHNWTVTAVPGMDGLWLTPAFRNGSHGLVNSFFGWLQIGYQTMIYETFDGGDTWTKIEPEGPIYCTDLAYIPGTENTWISTGGRVVGDCGASVSHDGGHTWEEIPGTSGSKFRYMDWIDENIGWAGSFNADDSTGGMFNFFKDATGVKQIQKPDLLSVYPNPADDWLMIRADQNLSGIHIFDISGRELASFGKTSDNTVIDVQFLPTGLYIVELRSDSRTVSEKLVIQHQ